MVISYIILLHVQGFGILAQQIWPLAVAFNSPITKWPTSIAESAEDLRGATTNSKSKYRNDLLQKTNSVSHSYPLDACWIFDGGKFIRSSQPEKSFSIHFFLKCHHRAAHMQLVFTYLWTNILQGVKKEVPARREEKTNRRDVHFFPPSATTFSPVKLLWTSRP